MIRPLHVFSSTVIAVCVLAATPARAQVEDDLREGDRYFEEGQYKKAAQRYDSAIERSPAQVSAEAYGQRAAIYIIQKNYRGGLDFITVRAERVHPDAVEVLEQKALILWLLGRRADAIAIAEKVVARRPETYSNQGILGEFYAGREPAQAITAYEAYFRHRPESLEKNDVLPHIRLGFSYLAVERYRDAEAEFQLLLRKYRRTARAEINARNGLCAAYTALGEYDRAIALCEQITANPRHVDKSGAVWYNLGQAYLGKRQSGQARNAGNRFLRLRRTSPKGYILVGDSYFQEREWTRALQYYLDAQKRVTDVDQVEPGERPDAGQTSQTGVSSRRDGTDPLSRELAIDLQIKIGTTYRRLGRFDEAIGVLESALASNADSVALVSELGNAYLASRNDGKAITTVDRLIESAAFDSLTAQDKVALLTIAGRGLYNRRELDKASQRYRAAYDLRKSDVKVRIGLVQTVNLQAYEAMAKGKVDVASTFLTQAYEIDPSSSLTNRNLAVMALRQARCDDARPYLAALEKVPGAALVYHRLLARAYACQRKPDRNLAVKHYALAEKEALDPDLQANLLRAEIYTEWAPLLFDSNLDDAISKLEIAEKLAARNPEVGDAARRNLALASYRRGWRNLAAGKTAAAVNDLQVASREPRLLRGTEPAVFAFSLAIAYLDSGESAKATRILGQLEPAGKANYLRAPYDSLGIAFFNAYAMYRSGNSKLVRQATGDLTRMLGRARGTLATRMRELLAAAWLDIASDVHRSGSFGSAKTALSNAARFVDSSSRGKMERIIEHNQVVLAMGDRAAPRASIATLERLAESVPEALANLGILYDRLGQPREAYDAWNRARQRGVRSRTMQEWIDTKKRMYGF